MGGPDDGVMDGHVVYQVVTESKRKGIFITCKWLTNHVNKGLTISFPRGLGGVAPPYPAWSSKVVT